MIRSEFLKVYNMVAKQSMVSGDGVAGTTVLRLLQEARWEIMVI